MRARTKIDNKRFCGIRKKMSSGYKHPDILPEVVLLMNPGS